MSDHDLIRRDNEYQREIRRRKMTDAAKIGLLVTQNIQQFQTNQILAQVHIEACRTNQFLGYMASTLDQIAHLQATHFEQVQRERSLKEVMFQFGKFLDETEAYGDPVAAAFGMKRLFEVLDRPENGFSTADLSDFGDKKHFDVLITRARSLLTGLPQKQYEEMEQFEQLLGVYYERKATGFHAERAFPKKQHIMLSEKFQHPLLQDESPPEHTDLTIAKKDGKKAEGIAGCGGCLFVIGVAFSLLYFAMFVTGEMIVTDSGHEASPLGPMLVFAFLATIGAVLLVNYFSGKQRRKERQEDAERRQRLVVKKLQKIWEAKKRVEESKIDKANQKIDADNAEIDEKRRQATKLFQATMEEMRSLLNKFLDQYPLIQKFVARV